MWGAYASVSFFNADGKANAIVQSETAPGAAHTAFYRSQSFSISMAAFEACSNQFFPDYRQIVQVSTKQIDALTAGDFGV
ncbi:hypothetical protein D3C73_1519180 [compost metagenome]